MVCLKTLLQHKTYLFVLGFLCSLFCCSLCSSQSYATDWYVSQGTDYCKISLTQRDSSYILSSQTGNDPKFFGTATLNNGSYLCDNNVTYNYVVITGTYNQVSSSTSVPTFSIYDISSLYGVSNFNLPIISAPSGYSYYLGSVSSFHAFPYGTYRVSGSNIYSRNLYEALSGYGIDIELYSSSPVSTPEPCPDCPPIPEYPYSDDLKRIYHAILLCGATVFVLWFFKCIYKIIIKDTKR